jgi:hypothetical protein
MSLQNNKLMQSKMTRREFLGLIGAAILSLLGIKRLLSAFNGPQDSKGESNPYGGSNQGNSDLFRR